MLWKNSNITLLTILLFSFFKVYSQNNNVDKKVPFSPNGLQSDIFLHPLNSNTAYTLRKGECVYNQAPRSLPFPSWGWIGITDRITAEIDFLPLIGGLFVKPNLPVPSFNFRFRISNQSKWKPALAFETMFQYIYNEFDQSDNPYFATLRQKSSWYNHLNASWNILPNFYLHTSIGVTYAQHLKLINKDSSNQVEKVFKNKITPDFSFGLDYRLKWISFHVNTSYGTTFNYIDNVPRKFEIIYGVRLAPFYKNRFGLLQTFRIEWAGFYNKFPEIQADAFVPIFIPYFYWQWRF